MADELIKTLTNEAGDERVLIVRRDNGVCTYRRQWKEGGGWGAPGPDAGLYDSVEAAENEARARVSWLVPLFH